MAKKRFAVYTGLSLCLYQGQDQRSATRVGKIEDMKQYGKQVVVTTEDGQEHLGKATLAMDAKGNVTFPSLHPNKTWLIPAI
jgi:hypothetical protein